MKVIVGWKVVSNEAKGDAAKLRAIVAQHLFVGVSPVVSDDGTFTLEGEEEFRALGPNDNLEELRNLDELRKEATLNEIADALSAEPSIDEDFLEEAESMGFPLAFARDTLREIEQSSD